MADHLTPAQRDSIDATVTRVHRERADAGIMAARYDEACARIAEQHDEIVRQRRRIEALEDQLHDRDADLRAQLAATTAPARTPVQHIDIYESSDYDVAAALEQAAEVREPITVTTCNNTITTYRAVPLDAHPRTERSTT